MVLKFVLLLMHACDILSDLHHISGQTLYVTALNQTFEVQISIVVEEIVQLGTISL